MLSHVIIYVLLFWILGYISFVAFNELLIFSFLYVEYNLKALYKPQEYPAASMGRYIKNYWLEVLLILGKYYLLPWKSFNLSLNVKPNSDTAILLVHGFCRNQSDWLWMRRQLKDLAWPIYCVNLEPMFAPIEEMVAHSLPAKIAQIKQQTNCKKLILIGHSMGGLASTYYSEFVDQEKLVTAVITIGTPYYGTKIAVAGPGKNARQMCPGSEFIHELHLPLPNSQKKYYQICSRFDNKVFPWQSALLEHTSDQHRLILPFTAHLAMLSSKEVAQQLKVWLEELKKIPA